MDKPTEKPLIAASTFGHSKALTVMILCLSMSVIALVTWNVLIEGTQLVPRIFLVTTAVLLAVMSVFHYRIKKASFTLWVLTCVLSAFCFPSVFVSWGELQLKTLIVPLIQVIMFGMGATLLLSDFTRVIKMPRAVVIGIFLQFLIMPILGFALASAFAFEPAIAVGIILIGSCPGGVASNVMTYLSKGNVALSVSMTACSTLIAPVMTPFLMSIFAGTLVDIVFLDWVVNILKIIIVPIAIGLTLNTILNAYKFRAAWLDRCLSFVAMFGICFIITIIIAGSRDKLLTIGLALVAVSIIHNISGYLLGYFGARLAKLDESSCRTVALEVGMQNGGMATALAVNVLKDPVIALAPAIFGPWMNISGSALATWWSARLPNKQVIETTKSAL